MYDKGGAEPLTAIDRAVDTGALCVNASWPAACPPLLRSQAFVDTSFDHITSTDHALGLLAQFTEVLQRDTLQQQLEGKWMVRGVQGAWF